MSNHQFPRTLWVVRHGQSAGNVARDEAEAAGRPLIDIATRDMDTPLSPLGEQQAEALGQWFGDMSKDERPTVVLSSPYVRAHDTAQLILRGAGFGGEVRLRRDERLREKEFGLLDRLTRHGIALKHPELSEQRNHVGKFYFRPPGGESWCDVILRLRSLLDSVRSDCHDERVLIVGHQVIVNCLRYLLECLDEAQILDIDRAADVPNCSVTSYASEDQTHPGGPYKPRLVNFVQPLGEHGAPVTAEPDVPAAPKS